MNENDPKQADAEYEPPSGSKQPSSKKQSQRGPGRPRKNQQKPGSTSNSSSKSELQEILEFDQPVEEPIAVKEEGVDDGPTAPRNPLYKISHQGRSKADKAKCRHIEEIIEKADGTKELHVFAKDKVKVEPQAVEMPESSKLLGLWMKKAFGEGCNLQRVVLELPRKLHIGQYVQFDKLVLHSVAQKDDLVNGTPAASVVLHKPGYWAAQHYPEGQEESWWPPFADFIQKHKVLAEIATLICKYMCHMHHIRCVLVISPERDTIDERWQSERMVVV